MTDNAVHTALPAQPGLGELVHAAIPQVLLLAALEFAWFMVLPLAVWAVVDVSLGAALPLLAGTALELIRLHARQRVRRRLRATFMMRAATHALYKADTIPEVRSDSAFWGAHIAEYGVSLDAPGIVGAGAAAAATLCVAAFRLGAGAALQVGAVLLCAVVLGVLSNRLRRRETFAIVDERRMAATWLAAAMRDNGELASSSATAKLLGAVSVATDRWSAAEDVAERQRTKHRLSISALAALALYAVAVHHGITAIAPGAARTLFFGSFEGTLLLASCLPSAYSFAAHLESYGIAHSELARLALGVGQRPKGANIRLAERPAELHSSGLSFRHEKSLALDTVELRLALTCPIGIAGPNGSGKTTLATLIAGVRQPTSGSVRLDGVAALDVSRDDVAFVPQDPVLVEALSIAKNLELVAADYDVREAQTLLRALGLDASMDLPVGNLSRGEQRRIATARALLKRPKLLVLDEPDAWLDVAGRRGLLRALKAIAHETTVFIVSHRPDLLIQLETVLVLNERHQLEAVGTPEQLRESSATFRALLGVENTPWHEPKLEADC